MSTPLTLTPNFIILQDEDRMPFGKYKGKRMDTIPLDYFNWLWNVEQFKRKTGDLPVAYYILSNLDKFEFMDSGYIW